MSTYVMSDIHGCYEEYRKMLDKIRFSKEDILYILGDILDRGPHPIKIMQDLMKRSNVVCLAGNHEAMALECLPFLLSEADCERIYRRNSPVIESLINWQMNGSLTTTDEFHRLNPAKRLEVVQFISEFELFRELSVNGKKYVLVHAGLGGFRPEKELWEYPMDALVWERTDYDEPYYPDKYVITGHTPTKLIPSNPRPGYIYQGNRHIAVDCGAGFGGRLSYICLETMEEFYVECKKKKKWFFF